MKDDCRLDLAEAIYASALEPARWPAALEKITKQLGVVATTISVSGLRSVDLFPTGHERPLDDYLSFWKTRNIIGSAIEKRQDGFYCDYNLFSSEIINLDPYYQEFRRAYGVMHVLGFAATFGEKQRLRFDAQLSLKSELPESNLLRDFSVISRHVRRAFEFTCRMDFARSFAGRFGDEIFKSPHAVVVLDADANVVFANDRFSSLVDEGIAISGHLLQCKNPKHQEAVDNVVLGVLRHDQVDVRNLALLSRPNGKRPFAVKAVPVSSLHRASADAEGLSKSHIILSIMDLEPNCSDRSEDTLRGLGLTSAECRTAALVGAGLSPRQIGSMLTLTEGTVRSCIKKIFCKLDLKRQSELSALVTKIQMFGMAG